MINSLIKEILRYGILGIAAFLFILGLSFVLIGPLSSENIIIALAIMTMGWALVKVANSEYL